KKIPLQVLFRGSRSRGKFGGSALMSNCCAFWQENSVPKTKATSGGKRHRCEECGKSFSKCMTKTLLNVHMRAHSEERPFTCDQCGSSFKDKAKLKRHSVVHTGKRDFSCDECGRSFGRLSTLRTHQLIHRGEKKHRCDQCGKAFLHRAVLKQHKLTHSKGASRVVSVENASLRSPSPVTSVGHLSLSQDI
uniref:C2H2-type domain-containing protein n=1 Tax=Neogobius melanostomus TaxID=47308 RepID=A0A8C6T9P9_9GOBI